jgi:hypothetical protein
MRRTVAVVTLVITAVAVGRTAAPEDRDLEAALALIDRLDDATVSVSYRDDRLADVIADLDRRSPVGVVADWKALDRLLLDMDETVTLRADDASMWTVLTSLAMRLGDEFERARFEVRGGEVVLTTESASTRMRLTDVYDVRDLLVDGRALERVRADAARDAGTVPPPAGGEVPDADAGDPAPDPDPGPDPDVLPEPPIRPDLRVPDFRPDAPRPAAAPPSEAETLVRLITDHVDPEAWESVGGTRATITDRDGVIVVSAPATTHRGLHDALRRLRRARGTAISLDAAIIDVPRADFETLSRRLDRSSAALVRALLARGGTSVVWQAASAVALDEMLRTRSTAGDTSVRLELLPTYDRAAGTLEIGVAVETSHHGDERLIETKVTVPGRRGGAALELPAATPGDTMRLLVLLPRRS